MANKSSMRISNWKIVTTIVFLTISSSSTAIADVESVNIDQVKQGLDIIWVLLAAFLVFFMQAGFGMLEAGFIRAKNTCNILTKNFLDKTINTIIEGAKTRKISDGKIFVLDLPKMHPHSNRRKR
jgi:hypothetical protein